MDYSVEDLRGNSLANFMKEHEKILEMDKMNLLKTKSFKPNHSVSSYGKVSDLQSQHNNDKSALQSSVCLSNYKIKDSMVKDASGGYILVNSREEEKQKLINLLSVPKTRHSCPNLRVLNKQDPSRNCASFVDEREKEKDRLAAIFASSGCQLSKATTHQISKNLNSEFSFNKTFQRESSKQNENENYVDNIPKICVSEYQGDDKNLKTSTRKTGTVEDSGNKMVRIGEFSPLNPNHPAARPTLGIGEYEQRRSLNLEQRNHEYNQYLQQKSQYTPSTSSSPSPRESNHRFKSAGTQTEWEEQTAYNVNTGISPSWSPELFPDKPELPCVSPCRSSPVPKCFQEMSEKEIKEHLYREELSKQIKEKNKLKEAMRKKDEEEEAKLEEKIRRDQEKMRRQYEEERLQRLELAIRKREHDDLLRQKLALQQQQTQDENKTKKKSILKKKSLPPNDTSSRSKSVNHFLPLSQSLPATALASRPLTDVHGVLRHPLQLDDTHSRGVNRKVTTEGNVRPSNELSALNQPSPRHNARLASPLLHNVKEGDMLVQDKPFEPTVNKTVPYQTRVDPPFQMTRNISEQIPELEEMLNEPLLPESYRVLPPMSPPLLHATIPPFISSDRPPVSLSRSPPVPASRRGHRTNSEVLEDKWKKPTTTIGQRKLSTEMPAAPTKKKEASIHHSPGLKVNAYSQHPKTVPYVERPVSPPDVITKHNRHVLTQLGAFRRHLQQERQRMRLRAQDDGP